MKNTTQTTDLLRQRADRLAHRRKKKKSTRESIPVLVFSVGAEQYGLDLHVLKEVRPLSGITPLPVPFKEFFGVFNVRGEIYSAMDLNGLLSHSASDASQQGSLLVLRDDNLCVGLRVDQVFDVKHIFIDELTSSKDGDTAGGRRFVKAITSDQIFILDGEMILKSSS